MVAGHAATSLDQHEALGEQRRRLHADLGRAPARAGRRRRPTTAARSWPGPSMTSPGRQRRDVVRGVRVQAGQAHPAGRRPARWSRSARGRTPPAARSAATTPCTHSAGSGWSPRTTVPVCSSGRELACTAATHVGEPVPFAPASAGEVPLDAEVAEQRGAGPEVQRVHPAGGVRRRAAPTWAPISSGGSSSAGPALDLLALQGVDAVAGPHPVGALQHAEVDPAAAGRAGLDLQRRGAARAARPAAGTPPASGRARRRSPVGRCPASTRSRLWSHLR